MQKEQATQGKIVNKRFWGMIISLGVLSILFTVLMLLKNNQKVCEFFATTISRWWILVCGTLFGWLPFSMYELLLICAILGAIAFVVFVILFLCKHKWKRLVSLVLSVAIAVMSFLNIYTATASFSYNRDPLPTQVYDEYDSEEFTYEDAVWLAETLVDKANYAYEHTEHDENGDIVYPFSTKNFTELSRLLDEEYKRLDGDYFSSYTPRGKRIINKWVMSELHVVGVFFAPFGEANVNGYETNLYLPLTLAHEMAHSKGVMREYQADIVAMYVLLYSDNVYLQYGALVKAVSISMSLLDLFPNSSADSRRIAGNINPNIVVERRHYSEFYSQFKLLDNIGEFFNDLYLKSQKQEGGTSSYVKPGEVVFQPGVTDDFGMPVVNVVHFSGTQNLLINMCKQGAFGER